MNLVAHQLLSFSDNDLQIGNLLGDFIKGKKYSLYPDRIKIGILLHREIDSFTDYNKIVKRSSSYFHKSQHKFSPIIIDVIYDYYLIKNWNIYSNITFEEFKKNCYSIFERASDNLPLDLQRNIHYLVKHDWYSNYKTIEGVQKTLSEIGKKSKYKNNLNNIISDFELNFTNLEKEFLLFFPEIINHCKSFLLTKFNISSSL